MSNWLRAGTATLRVTQSGIVALIDRAQEVTGLWTFDRGTAAPFAVLNTSAAKVTNLDADKLDGNHADAFSVAFTNSAELAGLLLDETGYSAGAKVVFSIAPVFGTSISTPAIVTASGALTVTPAAGSGVAIVLSTTGDFAINTNQLYVDTSTGFSGFGTATPGGVIHATTTAYASTSLFERTSTGTGPGKVTAARVLFKTTATSVDNTGPFIEFQLTDAETANGPLATIGAVRNGADNTGAFVVETVTAGVYNERFRITNSGNFGIGTTAPTSDVSIGGNAARTIWMERRTTANTAGNSLTVQAGGATSGATDKAGGDLLLKPGDSTGSAESGVQIFGVVAGASGTADRTQTKAIQVLGNKLGFYAVTPVVRPTALTSALTALTHTAPGTPDYALQNLAAGGFGFVTADEGNTMLTVLVRTALRVGELETKLQALGLLT